MATAVHDVHLGDARLGSQDSGAAPMKPSRPPAWLQVSQALERMSRGADRPPVVYLQGGHYDPRHGADVFSRGSLAAALDLGVLLVRHFGRRVRLVYGVLVDDLGLSCGEDTGCALDGRQIDAGRRLPPELEEQLAACHLIKRNRVEVFRERAAKNRGIRRLKQILASGPAGLPLQEDQDERETRVYLEADDGERVLLARYSGSKWVAGCPLVMGQHYADVYQRIEQRFSPAVGVLLVDYSQINDRSKVIRGAELALRLLIGNAAAPRQIIHVLFANAGGQRTVVADLHRDDFGWDPGPSAL